MLELLCSLAAQRASGMLEVNEDKKKRVFWYEGGRVTATKSNLRSETLKSLREKSPDAENDDLIALQGAIRVRSVIAAKEGDWSFTPNEPPPARRPIELIESCWLALCEVVTEAELRGRFAGLMRRFPTVDDSGGVSLESLPLAGPLKELIGQLDGQRPLGDVIDFAPMPPSDALRGVYLAMACGVVKVENQANTPRVIGEGPVIPPAAGKGPDDVIAGLFDAALGAPEPVTEIQREAPPPDAPTEPAMMAEAQVEDPRMRELREGLARIEAAENVFEVIGVAWDASEAEYRKAYFKLAQDYHPDRWTTASAEASELAGQIFARVGEAWEALGERDARQATIDRVIHGKKTEDELAMEKVQDILAAEESFKAGMADFNAGRIVQAHEAFQRAMELVPEEHEYRAFYGYTLFKMNLGRDDAAAEEGAVLVKEATDAGTKLHNGWMLAGMIYRDKGQLDIAMKALLTALKINPANAMAQRELRRVKRMRDKEKEDESSGIGGFIKGLFGRKK
ncbi:MAG: DnaJ domain-containing protein [Alphaproteobacteria bacterium]|nr:DnaJ domain-containing protein [Alphaproteobacteria bacterium]MCB9795949.1 DnaJ domain-containing protein [Alphaproteobacteria bacterium]